jgi:hypothetical protein
VPAHVHVAALDADGDRRGCDEGTFPLAVPELLSLVDVGHAIDVVGNTRLSLSDEFARMLVWMEELGPKDVQFDVPTLLIAVDGEM